MIASKRVVLRVALALNVTFAIAMTLLFIKYIIHKAIAVDPCIRRKQAREEVIRRNLETVTYIMVRISRSDCTA